MSVLPMKNMIAIIAFMLSFGSLGAQENNLESYPKDEPYPAPVSYAGLTEAEAAFIGLFNNEDVGNLHVFPSKNPVPANNYYFTGQPIGQAFINFLPSSIAPLTYLQQGQPHAVMGIRGETGELYLVRLPGEVYDNEIGLYDRQGGKLRKQLTLAAYECRRNRCAQLDSWIQDVNGDTRLDVISRKKITRSNGKQKVKTTVYIMEEDGSFHKDKKAKIDEKDYIFEKLE